jgi:hypothetical protein
MAANSTIRPEWSGRVGNKPISPSEGENSGAPDLFDLQGVNSALAPSSRDNHRQTDSDCRLDALDAILRRGGARTIHQHSHQRFRERYGASYARQRRPMLRLPDNLLQWRSGRLIGSSKSQCSPTTDASSLPFSLYASFKANVSRG